MINTNEPKGNYYIIADHLRTTIFALADGAVFEPKGRGYILKKLVKKATLLGYLLGLNSKQLEKISEKLIEVNSSYCTYLSQKKELIISELTKEINKTMDFINKSTQELDNYYSPKITARDIFFYYDTKGIPLELIRSYLENKKYNFPETEFAKLLTEQKKRGLEDRNKKKLSVF
ncbi:7371_t:CDS:1 [Entrophospora sp. SA101]|nr:7371_t:CDS:1 [Entrophospora sp. SA101]